MKNFSEEPPLKKRKQSDNYEAGKSWPKQDACHSSPSLSNGKAAIQNRRHSYEDSRHILKEQKKRLPIYFGRNRLIEEIRKTDNVIIMSETGSGKTTQIPQYLMEAGMAQHGIIGCTQPRRVAAITVADRVAKEKDVALGGLVGFAVRFEDMTSKQTKIKYMTDGILLREAILDPLLKSYSTIILDEAHERTIHTDILFGVVKSAQKIRKSNQMKNLKIVIMSATLEAEHFANYFNNAKILYVEGRRYPVKMMYTVNPQTDYIQAALVSTLQLHQGTDPGHDILVFLTGQEEIEALAKLITDCASHIESKLPQLVVCPLFAALPSHQQMKAFNPAPIGCRKVILATNIAETSITIPGVKYVIDTGMVKVKGYNPQNSLDMLITEPVSKAQARQRAGRAGRESSGICYRLYTEESFRSLAESSIPEIKRSNLSSVILNLLAIGIINVTSFDFMDPPSTTAIQNALEELILLGAVNSIEKQQLTDTGKMMANFPLDPKLSKCILASRDNSCTAEVVTIVALLSVESITYSPSDRRDHVNKIRQKFISSEGDHITLLNTYRAHKQVKGNHSWCKEHYINSRAMKTVHKVRNQLREICQKFSIPLNSCGKDYSKIRQSLAAGLFTNSAELQKDGTYQTIVQKQQVSIHPSSALFCGKPAFLVYTELVKTSKCYMRNVSLVDPQWLIEACPKYFQHQRIMPQIVKS